MKFLCYTTEIFEVLPWETQKQSLVRTGWAYARDKDHQSTTGRYKLEGFPQYQQPTIS